MLLCLVHGKTICKQSDSHNKKLTLSHDSNKPVTFTIEVEPVGHGPWMTYNELTVKVGESITHDFPDDFQARWVRFKADKDCKASAWLEYN